MGRSYLGKVDCVCCKGGLMGVQSRNVLGHGEGRAKANQAKHSDKTFAHLQVTRKCIEKLLKSALEKATL